MAGVAVGLAAAAPQHGSGSGAFTPKSRTISRTTLAGVEPGMSFAQIKAQWGRSPGAGPRPRASVGVGRSFARWGNYFAFGPTVAVAYYAGTRPGSRPFRYALDLLFARRTGIELRTVRSDRAGTPVRQFRRRWPGTRRIVTEPGYTWYVAPSSHRGWRLAFLFTAGRLKEAELVTADYLERCVVRRCSAYPGGDL